MAYKIERDDVEHRFQLQRTLMNWNYQEHDLYLLSSEGQKILTNKALVSVYSSIFKDILNDPSVAFSFQVPTVSVPGTFSCLSMLLKILAEGKAIANEKADLKEVTELANVLGIRLQNIKFDQFNEADSRKGYQFTVKKELLVDQIKEEKVENSEGNQNQWACSICNRVYSTKKLMQKHKSRYCKKKTTIEQKESISQVHGAKCAKCGKIFKNRKLLRYHRYNAHKEKTLKCGTCPMLFSSTTNLKRHTYTHLPESERPFQCEMCSQTFIQLSLKKRHMMKSHDSIPLKEQENIEGEADNNITEVNINAKFEKEEVEEIVAPHFFK